MDITPTTQENAPKLTRKHLNASLKKASELQTRMIACFAESVLKERTEELNGSYVLILLGDGEEMTVVGSVDACGPEVSQKNRDYTLNLATHIAMTV